MRPCMWTHGRAQNSTRACLSRPFCCCDEKFWSKAKLGGKGFFGLSRSQSITEQTREETQAGAEAVTMEECGSLARCVTQQAFLHSLGPELKNGAVYRALDSLLSVNQGSLAQTWPQTGLSDWRNSSTRFLSSQVTLSCVDNQNFFLCRCCTQTSHCLTVAFFPCLSSPSHTDIVI